MERNRKIILGLLGGLISILIAGAVRPGKAQTAKSDETPKWETIVDGVEVLRLRPNAEHGQAQVVVLRLSPSEQAQFDSDPRAFLNKYNLFPQTVTVAANLDVERPQGGGTVSVAALSDDGTIKRPKDGQGGKTGGGKTDGGSGKAGGGKTDGGSGKTGGGKTDGGSGKGPSKPIKTCVTICDDFDGTGKGRCYKVCN